MAINFPIDIITDFPGWPTEFRPIYSQERARNGKKTFVKDLADPLWFMSMTSKRLKPNQIDFWRARLGTLENGINTFLGFNKARCFPIAYPKGNFPPATPGPLSPVINTINANRKAIALSGLVAGYVLSVGDYLSINGRDLHMIVETAAVNVGTGISNQFEIRPHLYPDVTTTLPVSFLKPAAIMQLVPDSIVESIDITGRGTISFQAMEYRA